MEISRITFGRIQQIGYIWYDSLLRVTCLVLILFFAQLKEAATGLNYLHESGFVHGDLKGVCSCHQHHSVP